jgi:transcriptional regulator with XRE-family HTH domain
VTESEIIALIRQQVADAGSLRGLARRLGIAPSYLSDVLTGKAPPGDAVLGPLGYEKITSVSYRKANQ